MQKILLFATLFSFAIGNSNFSQVTGLSVSGGSAPDQTTLYEDNFESYAVGDFLAVENPTWWTTWSNQPGGPEDAPVTNQQSLSPTQSVIVQGTTDAILKLGDKTSGKYQLNFNYYIPSGYSGYYNIQHFESPGIEWACEVYFGANGTGELYAGQSSAVATFSFNHNDWIFIDNIFDLDKDSAMLFIDGIKIYQWKFSVQANGGTGTKRLGGMNLYAGGPVGETPKYYLDDLGFYEISGGTGNPIINVSPMSMTETLNQGATSSQQLLIENTGDIDLDYDIFITYGEPAKGGSVSSVEKNTAVLSLPARSPELTNGGSPGPSDNVILNYDGPNFSAIGLIDGGLMTVGARFPASMVGQYAGMELTQVEVYINDPPNSTVLKIFDYGLPDVPGPGSQLYQESWIYSPNNWNVVNLSSPVFVNGGDLWVTYAVDHQAGTFPAGTDQGPAHPDGDWISSGPGWGHLSSNPALDYNWNIRAHLTGTPISQWLSVTPASGTVAPGATENLLAGFDASGLLPGNYSATIVVNNNDASNSQVEVDVTLTVIDAGINTFPYAESFETGFGNWIQSQDDDFDWTLNQGSTPSSGTGPSAAYEGNFYLYTEASAPNSPNKTAGIYTTFDLTNLDNPVLSFYYHMFGSDMGTLTVQASIAGSGTWTDLWTLAGDQGDVWHNEKADLAVYANTPSVMIRFIGETGAGYRSDMAVDFIEVYNGTAPVCTSPVYPPDEAVDIPVNVTLSWNAEPDATGYLIWLGTDNPPTNIENGTDLGDVLSYAPSLPLLFNTDYHWKIKPYNQYGEPLDCPVWAFTTEEFGYEVDLKVFIEGPYMGPAMSTVLNVLGYLPLGQPYNTAPWWYQGTEAVTEIPNNDVVEWVLIELRDAVNASGAGSSTVIARRAVFLMKDGMIRDLDGVSLPAFDVPVNDNLFAVIWHRNHLAVMSADPLSLTGDIYSYDFTDDPAKVYGGAIAHKELSPGVWGMRGGDGNPDGQVGNSDKLDVWNPQSGNSGYLSGDFSLDGQVNNVDKVDVWVPNSGNGSQVPD